MMIGGRMGGRGVWKGWVGASLLSLNLGACGSDAAPESGIATAATTPASSTSGATSGAAGASATTPTAGGSAGAHAAAGGTSATPGSTLSGSAGVSAAGASAAQGGSSAAGSGASGSSAVSGSSGGSAVSGSGGGSAESGSGGSSEASGGSSAESGSGGGSAGSGTSGAGAAGTDAATPHEDLGKGDGHDVVLIGDSWMSNTLQIEGTGGGIAPSLQRVSGQPYRNYAVQGVMLLSADAFGPAIPTQWDSAKRVNPDIKTVVMTGGGNDVIQNPGLQSDCQMDGEQCKQFRMNLLAALDKLWTQMASDGVEDIIYVRYSANAGSGSSGMQTSDQNATVPVCTTGKVRCHALDTTDIVMSELAADNIHPLLSANDRMAKALVDMMEKEGMRR